MNGDAVGQRRAEERARRLGEEDVPTLPSAAEPSGAYDVEAEVALLAEGRLARVEAHPHAHVFPARPSLLGVGPLRRDRARHGITRAGEGEEQRVALRVDLDPAVGAVRLADDAAVLRNELAVALAQPLQEPGGALDVTEDEGDRPGRQGRHASILATNRA